MYTLRYHSPCSGRSGYKYLAILSIAITAILAGCAATSTTQTIKRPKKVALQQTAPKVRVISNVPVVTTHWAGRYQGQNPSCTGMARTCHPTAVVLTLQPDYTYSMQMTVRRHNNSPYSITSTGRFRWDELTQTVTLASKDANTRFYFNGQTLERIGSDTMSAADVQREPMVLRQF